MDPNIQLGFQLLLVGMLSVFFILGIVVGLGKVLILTVNKYSPQINKQYERQTNSIDQKQVVVLSSVVELVTQGKGVITSINKI
jgi:oxaloacetate decarboxylase gamma subunit